MAEYTLTDLYRASMQRRLSQAEVDWIIRQRDRFPYLPLPHAMLARQVAVGDPLFRAAVYAPDRSQLRQYIKGRLSWSGLDHQASDPASMSDDAAPPVSVSHCPPLFTIATVPSVAHRLGADHFGLYAASSDATHFHAYLDQLCRELGQRAARLRAELRRQMADYHHRDPDGASLAKGPASYFPSRLPATLGDAQRQHHTRQLIDRFLSASPTLARPKPALPQDEPEEHQAAKASNAFDDTLATETLATLYLRQGNRAEARRVYQQLCLRFPEKSDYFEAQIKKLS
jgi:hypothetical protein